MKKSIRLLALLLVALTFTGCSAGRPVKSKKEDTAAVGKVGSYEVPYEELRFVTLKYRAQMSDEYGDGIWDDAALSEKYRDELYRFVTENLTANYAVLSLCAEVSITPDLKEIKDSVKKFVDEYIDEVGGRQKYIDSLKENYLTDNFFRFSLAVDYCQNELYYVYTDDLGLIETDESKIYDYIMADNFVRTVHVFIRNDPGDDIETNRRSAENVRERLLAGEDINKIIGSAVNEDFDLTTTDGYYFTRGEMINAYETAAFGTEIGGISDVVETYSGFYVIKRMPLEASYVMLNLATLVEQYQYSELNRYIDERQAELSFEFNDYGRSLDLTKIS